VQSPGVYLGVWIAVDVVSAVIVVLFWIIQRYVCTLHCCPRSAFCRYVIRKIQFYMQIYNTQFLLYPRPLSSWNYFLRFYVSWTMCLTRCYTGSSSADEIAKENFFNDDIVHVLQNTIDSLINLVFVDNQHGIQRRGQDFDKKVSIWNGTQQRGWQMNFLRKAGQSVVLVSCWKSCGTQSHQTLPHNNRLFSEPPTFYQRK